MNKSWSGICILLPLVLSACQHNQQNDSDSQKADTNSLTVQQDAIILVDAVELQNNTWLLSELNGEVIRNYQGLLDTPSIRFRSEDQFYFAKTGCNGIAGAYSLTDGNSIAFQPGFRTEMACPNMKIEEALIEHLPRVSHYLIDVKQLTLLTITEWSLLNSNYNNGE